MIGSVQRLVSVVILIGWLAPSAAALGIGMHLAAEHHDPHALEHRQELAELVQAATHGHHHDLESAPDHRHEARFDGQAPTFRTSLVAVAALPPAASLTVEPAELDTVDRSRRRGPPRPLFTAHCSLLL